MSGCFDFSTDSRVVVPLGRGAAVADEPRAVLAARDILEAGGSAADAAVALYFALAVTYPSSAGLGGGGVCVVRSRAQTGQEKPRAEVLDFIGGPISAAAPPGLMRVAVPGNVRGMFALHARYGRLQWEQAVFPGERLARFGAPISRAFATELTHGASTLDGDPAARRLYSRPDGSPLREGDHLAQGNLAGVLGSIRARGPGAFYSGELARVIVAGARDAGAYLAIGDLRNFKPKWRKAVKREFHSHAVYFPPEPIGGGVTAASLWKVLYEDGAYGRAKSDERDAALAKAASRVLAEAGGGGSSAEGLSDPAVTGFAVMDGAGGAVACAVTMNGRFGAGRLIRDTGIIAAAAPAPGRDGRLALAPIVVANENTSSAVAAAAPSGNAAAPTALISVALRVLRDEQDVAAALGASRVHPGADSGTVYVERRKGAAPRLGTGAGLTPIEVPSLGRVNVIFCPKGLPDHPESCVFAADPRGSGYAVDAVP